MSVCFLMWNFTTPFSHEKWNQNRHLVHWIHPSKQILLHTKQADICFFTFKTEITDCQASLEKYGLNDSKLKESTIKLSLKELASTTTIDSSKTLNMNQGSLCRLSVQIKEVWCSILYLDYFCSLYIWIFQINIFFREKSMFYKNPFFWNPFFEKCRLFSRKFFFLNNPYF